MVSLTSQLLALRRMNAVDQQLRILEKRLDTGNKVRDMRDSTSAVAASRSSRLRYASLSTVQSSLGVGIATVSTAASAVTTASGFLGNIRDLLEAAKDGSADLASIQTQLSDQRMKLRSTVSGAMFQSVNLLASNSSNSSFLGAPKDPAGSAYSINVDRTRTRLLDTVGSTGILQKTFILTSSVPGNSAVAPSTLGLSGTATSTAGLPSSTPATSGLSGAYTTVEGVAGYTPSTNGLSGGSATISGAAATAAPATARVGTYNSSGNASGDTVNLSVTLNSVTKTVKVYQRTITDGATLQAELQRAVDAEFGANQLTAQVGNDNIISLTTIATGSGQSVSVANVSVVDGNDITTTTLGLVAQTNYTSTESTIDGRARVRARLGAADLTGLDKTDRLRLKIDGTVNDVNRTSTIDVELSSVTGTTSLASAIDAVLKNTTINGTSYFGAAVVDGAVVVYLKLGNDSHDQIRVSSITALNGNVQLSGNLGFTTGSGAGVNGVSGVSASVTTGSDFAGPVTLQDGAALSFDLIQNGASRSVAINKATVEAALAGQSNYTAGSGTIANVEQYVRVAQQALAEQAISGVTVSASSARLTFTKSGAPANGDSIDVLNVSARSGNSTSTSLTTGSDFNGPLTIASNASLDFTLTVDGTAKTISVTKADVQEALTGRAGYTNDSGTIANTTEFALVVQKAMSRQGLTGITVAASNNRLVFTKTVAGAGTLAISGVAGSSTATAATLRTGSDFTGPVTIDQGATISFDLTVDGGSATRVTIQQSTVEAALASTTGRTGGSGTISNVAEFALVVWQALSEANVGGINVSVDNQRIKLAKTITGAGQIAIGAVSSAAASVVGPSSITIDSLNVNSPSFASLSSSQRRQLLDDYIANIEVISKGVSATASYLAFVGKQMEIQSSHTSRLQAIELSRVSKMVNADLDADGARRAALEIRLAMVRKSFDIVNQSRKHVLDIL